MTLKRWLQVHRFLGLFAAPMVLLFAISGAWQVWDLHRSKKNGSYVAPAALGAGSSVHMAKPASGPAGGAFRVLVTLVALSLAANAGIGVAVGLRLTQDRRWVWLCLSAGALLPLAAFFLGRG
jgi:hypothetical protein